MKILIADKFESAGIEGIRELGCEVDFAPDLTADRLPEALADKDPDVLIVRSTKVSGAAMAGGARLSLIIRAGAGYDTIDVAAASGRGIFVANCPGKNSLAVAELTIGLLLCCDRLIPDQTAELRDGRWNKKFYSGVGRGLHGRTLGIIGMGRIAQAVAQRAQAFGMNVVAWSRSLTPTTAQELGLIFAATPIDVARQSDAVSINVASTAETKHLVNAEFLAAMKDGAYLINTSRGALIDENALAKAISEKNLRVALDVYDNEPGAGDKQFSNPIVKASAVIGTHHVGASTAQAQLAVADETVRIIKAYCETGAVPNCVNRLAKSSATHLLSVRHRNRSGVLSHVFGVLADHGINVEEVENIIYNGAEATCARIHLDAEPDADLLMRIKTGSEHVIAVGLSRI